MSNEGFEYPISFNESSFLKMMEKTQPIIFLSQKEDPPFHFDSTLHALLRQKKFLMDWWLKLIEYEVEKWLENYVGFVPDQIPYDYLDKPPKDLNIIEKNLSKIRTILSAIQEKQGVSDIFGYETKLRGPTLERILDKIREFLQRVTWVLIHFLAEAFPGETQTKKRAALVPTWLTAPKIFCDLQSARKLRDHFFQQLEGSSLSYLKQKQLYLLYNDALDLLLIKLLEDPRHSKHVKNLKFDMVPLSGIIEGKLHRIENEHKTVVEHWGQSIFRKIK